MDLQAFWIPPRGAVPLRASDGFDCHDVGDESVRTLRRYLSIPKTILIFCYKRRTMVDGSIKCLLMVMEGIFPYLLISTPLLWVGA